MKKVLANILLAGLLATVCAARNNDKAAPADTKKSAVAAKTTDKAAAAKESTMDAYISDEKCGANVDASCSKKCQESGAKLVVVNVADKSVIPVSNQSSVKPFVGQHVTVKGTMENGALKVASVQAVKEGK